MPLTVDDIVSLYGRRRLAAGPAAARMRDVQQLVDGDIAVPLPELDRFEMSSIPNRAKNGLHQLSTRLASSTPDVWYPPTRPGTESSEKRARDRRSATLGWWGHSRMGMVLRQRARYLLGYARTPAQVTWDVDDGVPLFSARNPLVSYPAPTRGVQDICPYDCIFETEQTLRWLRNHYPEQSAIVSKKRDADMDTRFTVLEYTDPEDCVLVLVGQTDQGVTPLPNTMAVQLERYPNRAGRCNVVAPQQIALSRIQSQFDHMIGMHVTEAKLNALAIIATEKGVLGDYWLIARPGEEPFIEQIPEDDGTPGVVKGGDLERMGPDPQFQTNTMMDRLADAQMRDAGLSSEMQGVAPTNVRTGVRSQQLLSNVIDFPLQEAQELLQESLAEENKIAVAYAKAYGGRKSFYVNWAGARGDVTYDPATTFETDNNIVRYPLAGADQAGLVISGGQRLGMGTLSKYDFMRLDPLVEDAEATHDRIIGEKLEEATLAGLEQAAASGALPVENVARIAELVVSNQAELFGAIRQAGDEAKQAQAQQAAPDSPEAQPGLSAPPQPQLGPAPSQGQSGLAALLGALRGPQRALPQETQGVA